MSAYVVNDETISVIAKGIVKYNIDVMNYVKFDSMALVLVNLRYQPIGQWLLDQNYKSINYRYDKDTPTREFHYIEDVPFDEGKLLGCINCYNYQVCELPNYDESPIHSVLWNLRLEMLNRMIEQKGLDIPWGM